MATKLPSIPDISESSLKRAVIALKEIIEVGIERRGDPLDRFVKLRELLTLLEEDSQVSSILNTALGTEFSADGEILVGTGSGTFQAESGATLRTSVGCDPIGTDNSTDVTLDASAITGGLSIIDQDISNRAATSAQTGYATAAQITKLDGIEALADVTSTHETSHADVLVDGDVDDTPVDAATMAPISSNWAYDHDNDANAHHTQNADTALGAQSEDLDMNTHQVVSLSVPDANGEAIRQTDKITEAALEIAIDAGGATALEATIWGTL